MSWSGGYVSEIDYTFGYYRELSPMIARFALAAKGTRAALPPAPTYLELGFGQAVSFAIHAAAGGGQAWGTDFHPAHAASAREMAAASGADVHAFDQSFEELAARQDLPELDMIALHGVWSWVSAEVRRVIVDLVHRRLKPGGVVYLSYNVLPGWTPTLALRHLLTLHADRSGSTAQGIVGRIDGALGFARQVADAGALYFKQNPAALDRLKKMSDRNRRYLAHEFFNADWCPMPFSEAVTELERAKLSFVCSANLLDHLDGLHLNSNAQALLKGISDAVLRESVRDYLTNQPFRRDLLVRGPRSMSGPARQEALRSLRVVLARAPESIELEVKGALGKATLQPETYRPLIEVLAGDTIRPRTIGEVIAELAARGTEAREVIQAITLLVGKGDLEPAQDERAASEAEPRTRALNRYFLHRSRAHGEIHHLASPVTGGGIPVSPVEQLLLLSRDEGKKTADEWARETWDLLSSQGQRMLKDGKPLESPEDNLAEVQRQARELETKRLPVLRALGVP